MEKLLYYKSYKTNPNSEVLCTYEAFYDEVKSLLNDYIMKGLLRVTYFDDDESIVITRNWDVVDWYEVYTLLKDNGYTFTNAVEKQYKYFEGKHNERVEKERERKERAEKLKAQAKAEPKYETGYWCGKYDCMTTLAFCEKCWYRRKHLETCSPITIKIQKGE